MGDAMKLYTLYVGQGAMSVLVGDREAILIDAHLPPLDDKHAEYIKKALAAIVAEKKVVGLLLTGLDADHADHRGVALVLRRYQPHWVMYPTYFKPTATATTIFKKIIEPEVVRRASTKQPLVKHSIRCDTMKTRTWKDLTDEWNFVFFSPHVDDLNCSNNGSIVAKITPKDELGRMLDLSFSLLVTGDTENDRWEAINRIYGGELSADVLAAPHHGSKNGINKRTLQLVAPHTVIISCGVENQYGHPDREALDLYRKYATEVWCTGDGTSYETVHSFWKWGGVVTQPWSVAKAQEAA